ncbi:DUF3299 domain-containing protein [Ereboglobus luteus]|uniref:DUF3299 domain-containing protein n=1 Tax=Ereboglobus luteus TaxID=1796921 RepID=A0A2U8E2C6_9BACT|nr:DUF3299 domain-containing protein [Ereboglobus luteus]AWI09029.1 hypothetical protein CKA38_07050 [Ereboglobus luteus]
MTLAVRFLSLAAAFALICAVAGANTGRSDDNKVGFDVFGGFPFSPPAYDPDKPNAQAGPQIDEQLPAAVRKLNGKKATITGFMLPVRTEGGRVVEFLLLRDRTMCCFGEQPQMNEWVVVRMAKPDTYLPDVPKSFEGTLRVGAIEENGYLSGIYLLENASAVK